MRIHTHYTVGNVGTPLNELAAKFKSITKFRFRTKKKINFFRMETTSDISILCITNISTHGKHSQSIKTLCLKTKKNE